jgi:hypothetical protein
MDGCSMQTPWCRFNVSFLYVGCRVYASTFLDLEGIKALQSCGRKPEEDKESDEW